MAKYLKNIWLNIEEGYKCASIKPLNYKSSYYKQKLWSKQD